MLHQEFLLETCLLVVCCSLLAQKGGRKEGMPEVINYLMAASLLTCLAENNRYVPTSRVP